MKNTPKTEENKELTGYEILLKKLDNTETAYQVRQQYLERGKDLIYQILGVTAGYDVVTGNDIEWGHRNILELLEMFLIRHKNFPLSTFAEDLQNLVFINTIAHDEARREWQKKAYAKQGLDENGIPLEIIAPETNETTPLDLSQMSTKDLETDDCDEEATRQSLAEQLSNLVSNPCLPPELRAAIICGKDESRDVLDVSASLTAQTTPESFKTILDAYSEQHGK